MGFYLMLSMDSSSIASHMKGIDFETGMQFPSVVLSSDWDFIEWYGSSAYGVYLKKWQRY